MPDLSQLVTDDSRPPIEKLRRCRLWQIADRSGIKYPPGAPKTTMVKLLEAHGVDITKPLPGVEWAVVYPDARAQQAAASFGQGIGPQVVPVERVHASARSGVNASMEVDRRITAKQQQEAKKEDSFNESRIEALEKENARLKEIIEKRLAALESSSSAAEPARSGPNASQREYWKAYNQAKGLGLPVKRTMKREEIEALIRESQRTESASE